MRPGDEISSKIWIVRNGCTKSKQRKRHQKIGNKKRERKAQYMKTYMKSYRCKEGVKLRAKAATKAYPGYSCTPVKACPLI